MESFIEVNVLFGLSVEYEIAKYYKDQIGFCESSNLPLQLTENTSGSYIIFCTYGKIHLSLHVDKGEKRKYRIYYTINNIVTRKRRG